jgi:hypothetical protein
MMMMLMMMMRGKPRSSLSVVDTVKLCKTGEA